MLIRTLAVILDLASTEPDSDKLLMNFLASKHSTEEKYLNEAHWVRETFDAVKDQIAGMNLEGWVAYPTEKDIMFKPKNGRNVRLRVNGNALVLEEERPTESMWYTYKESKEWWGDRLTRARNQTLMRRKIVNAILRELYG